MVLNYCCDVGLGRSVGVPQERIAQRVSHVITMLKMSSAGRASAEQ